MIVEYNNITCIEANWLINDAMIISESNYKQLNYRGIVKKVRTGGNGRTALIEYKSIPAKYKEQIIDKLGFNPEDQKKYLHFRKYLVPIRTAIEYFGNYKLENGQYLKTEIAKEYCTNAMFLNACHQVSITTASLRKALTAKRTGIWQALSEIVNDYKVKGKDKNVH